MFQYEFPQKFDIPFIIIHLLEPFNASPFTKMMSGGRFKLSNHPNCLWNFGILNGAQCPGALL